MLYYLGNKSPLIFLFHEKPDLQSDKDSWYFSNFS